VDKTTETINTYNFSAKSYQDKFMNMDLYNDTFDLLLKLIKKENPRILDIPCGPGNISYYVKQKVPGAEIIGADLAYEMLKLARLNIRHSEFTRLDMNDLDKLNDRFDCIICGFGLPYLSSTEAAIFIKKAYNLINKEGFLYISSMEGENRKSGFETTSFSNGRKIFINYHKAEEIIKTLVASGFQIIKRFSKKYPEEDGTFSEDFILISKKQTR
jgi:ubiquinone/menaquinone biosynthesis C-methylase UbiE